jgi:hypothetical protein
MTRRRPTQVEELGAFVSSASFDLLSEAAR